MIKIIYEFEMDERKFKAMYNDEDEHEVFSDYVEEIVDDMSINDIMEMSINHNKSVEVNKLKVGMVVQLIDNRDYGNAYAIIDEVDEDESCAVVIFDRNGNEYDEIAWLEEGDDFIVCPQYNVYNIPNNEDIYEEV